MKKIVFLGLLVLHALALVLSVTAEDDATVEMPEEYNGFVQAIPSEVAELLPEDFFSGDAEDIANAINELAGGERVLAYLRDLLVGGLDGALKSFAILTAIVALGALLQSLITRVGSSLEKSVRFSSTLALSVSALSIELPQIASLSAYFSQVGAVMNSLLPLMGVLYMAGGNAAAAAVNNTTLVFWLNLLELALRALVLPAASVCIAIALADSLRVAPSGSIAPIGGLIKKSLGYVLGMCCTLLMAALSAQSIIATATDSMGARAAKYVAGNIIPVIGSTVGETLRTVAGSVKVLRSTVGVGGIIVILMLLLPTVVQLLFTRLALCASAAIGEMLGMGEQVRFYRELGSIYGYLIAAAALSSIMCCFALTVFALTSSAGGGL